MQVSDPIHLPCPDMAGMANPDPKKLERSCFLLQKLREKHGIKKRAKPQSKPMTYTCTKAGCIEPWGTISNGEPY
ncbi:MULTISPECIES: hypothetical protein [Vibrio oreintalis group]|uniref:hypothetical protein n=1 Tax=Vibrio oreintalis group TaxID=1891919 RepID=UPI00148BD346|nr:MULTISPECIES: hypothetical protein [Vibrio oreintalis group]MCG9728089.1 hypothetical protein [Vibrio brasiliensis]NOH25678.1 hypothetical protein [Vibrio europaeus]